MTFLAHKISWIKNYSKRVFTFFGIIICAYFALPIFAIAQNSSLVPDAIVTDAINLARKIEKNNITINAPSKIEDLQFEKYKGERKLTEMRFITMDTVLLRNSLNYQEIAEIYKLEAINQKSARDIDIANILSLYHRVQNADAGLEPDKSDLEILRKYKEHEDWFVAQRAALMDAMLPSFEGNLDVSLKDTKAALSLIPSELSQDVLEAQYETYQHIAFLHLVLLDIELGIRSTEQVIEKGLAHNRPVDGVSLINNLNYVFNAWHEYDTAEKLTEILFRLSANSSTEINSLVYYRYGQAKNNAARYSEALSTLNVALDNTEDQYLKQGIELARAVSFAGMGNVPKAEESLAEFDRIKELTDLHVPEHNEVKLHALALISLSKNQHQPATSLFNAKLKSVVQRLLDRQNKDVKNLQANLENDKNRVAEREAALMRETELKQSELEAKQRSNMFLMALAASLLLIAIAAIAFAVWRQKISKILEIAAHDAQAGDRAKSQFLSVMSHELRTPLNGIIGIAGILSEKGETKELRNYNKLILKSGENLLELLSGILDMAQMESGKLSIVTAPASIRQIIDGLYQGAKAEVDATKVQLTCFVADNVPEDLMLDSIRVKQSLSNLIANAVRFTEKGRIHIHTTMSEPDRKGVRELTMIVADTGRGITEEVKEKLFKPFVQADSSLTRSHDGAGIGLAVTRGLSRLMGGDVTMTSTAGKGSEFKMVIKTCIAREAEINAETNRPVFEIVPSAAAKIDFSPAVSIEKLRADADAKEKAQIQQDLYGAIEDAEPVVQTESEIASSETGFDDDENGFDDDDVEFETIAGLSNPSEKLTAQSIAPAIPDTSDNPRAGFSRNHPRSDTKEIEPDQLSGLNILVVEDIEANLEILCSLLEPVGCSVSSAENGQIALDIMKTQTFDAVLMDIRMPILDGIEATRAIRALPEPHCHTAIIALTADASAENNAECLAAGADVFLTKPVIVSELFSSIRFARRKQMRQKQQQQALSA